LRLGDVFGVATVRSSTIDALHPDHQHGREGNSVVLAAIDGRPAGLFAVADPIKEDARSALAALREEHIRVVMLTGDARATADAVARRLGIDEVIAEVLPDQKAEVVRRLQAEGRLVAMAGDGINDARHWRWRRSESRWAAAPTSRWKAPQ
jgi:P-type E1-E2 ATPase